VAIYTRPQMVVLLALVATAGVGLAVGQWRRAHPAIAERLERMEREAGHEAAADASAATVSATSRDPGDARTPLRGRASRAGGGDEAARWRPRPEKLGASTGGDGPAAPLDPNTALLEDLIRLPGVGAALAGRIVQARDAEPFASIDDLRRVRGLGRARIERLRPYLAVPGERVHARAGDPRPTARADPPLEERASPPAPTAQPDVPPAPEEPPGEAPGPGDLDAPADDG
jgi:DNA uptake protein ComE-like DNA-binding protein